MVIFHFFPLLAHSISSLPTFFLPPQASAPRATRGERVEKGDRKVVVRSQPRVREP